MPTLLDELQAHRPGTGKRVFGLILQGGGMRAAYSAGAIAPLVQYGLQNSFDHVIGSSAGGINAAYLLGADAETFHTYTDDLTNKNFINLMRKDKKVDIDFLVDEVLTHKRPVDLANLRKSPSQLHIVVTDAKTGKKTIISNHQQFAIGFITINMRMPFY